MGIDPINKISIIIRILFAVTLFQHAEGFFLEEGRKIKSLLVRCQEQGTLGEMPRLTSLVRDQD
jgi:hypothetical protein